MTAIRLKSDLITTLVLTSESFTLDADLKNLSLTAVQTDSAQVTAPFKRNLRSRKS